MRTKFHLNWTQIEYHDIKFKTKTRRREKTKITMSMNIKRERRKKVSSKLNSQQYWSRRLNYAFICVNIIQVVFARTILCQAQQISQQQIVYTAFVRNFCVFGQFSQIGWFFFFFIEFLYLTLHTTTVFHLSANTLHE